MTTMNTSSAKSVLTDLGRLIGIPCLAMSSDGSCRLIFDDEHLVSIVAVPALGTLIITCRCAGDPKSNPDLAIFALKENFMRAGTLSGTLSMGEDGRFYLHSDLNLEAATGLLVLRAIEQLLNRAEAWRCKVIHSRKVGLMEAGRAELLQR